MAFETLDISATFPSGVNTADFQRSYARRLIAGGMDKKVARRFVGRNVVKPTEYSTKSRQLVISGTYNVNIGERPILPKIRTALDSAIAEQAGNTFAGPTLDELEIGSHPGVQIYVYDGIRAGDTTLGAWVYWDGEDSWRYIRDDTKAVTPPPS